MKKLLIGALIGASFAAGEGSRVFTGVITDSMCGANHEHMKIAPEEKCVRECVRVDKRYKYALYDGKKVYVLSDQETPEKFAAKKVRVTGTLFEKTGIIQVKKIEAAR